MNGGLGDAAGWLVVATWDDAVRVAADVAELPRGKILVVDEFLRSLESEPEVRAGSVAEHVTGDRALAPLIGHLLGTTAIAENLETARELVFNGDWARAVTTSGEVVEKEGLVERIPKAPGHPLTEVKLTAKGEEACSPRIDILKDAIADTLSVLSEEELLRLLELTRSLQTKALDMLQMKLKPSPGNPEEVTMPTRAHERKAIE